MNPVDAFLDHLRVEKRMSAHTLDAYKRDLDALTVWTLQYAGGDVLALQVEDIRAFIAAEHRRGLTAKSLQRRLSACRSFYSWQVRQGALEASPAAPIRAPKAPRKLPQVLDPDEAKALVEVDTDAPLGLRDRALLELFYSSGLRLSELCALRWRDLDLDDALVTVLGKGNKQRSVPLGSHARAALGEWRASTGAGAEAFVFPGRGGAQISSRNCACVRWPSARVCSSACIRTCCGIPSPATSWNPPATCAACRNCWDMRTSRPRRSIRTWISSTWPRCTTRRIRARGAKGRAATRARPAEPLTQGRPDAGP